MSLFSAEITMQICSAPAAIMRSTRYSATALGRSPPRSPRDPTGSNSLEQPSGWMRCPAPAAGTMPITGPPLNIGSSDHGSLGPLVHGNRFNGTMARRPDIHFLAVRHQLLGTTRSGVLIERALAGASGHGRQVLIVAAQHAHHVGGPFGNHDFLPRFEKSLKSRKRVAHNRRSAGRRFEEAPRGAPAAARHPAPRDVQRDARG